MDRPLQAIRALAVEKLLPKLDHRMGSLLSIGASLPEVALHALKRGLFVTVVESDPARVAAYMEPLKEERVDKGVSVDSRPYEGIEFLSSSYNAIVAWDGIPRDMPPALFFKKIRRELKAGGVLYLHVAVAAWSPGGGAAGLRALAPPAVRGIADKALARVAASTSLPGACDLAALCKAADQYLNVGEVIPLGVFTERLMLLPDGVRKFLKLAPLPTLEVAQFLDRRLLGSRKAAAVSSSVLVSFAKTKEFGHVFRV